MEDEDEADVFAVSSINFGLSGVGRDIPIDFARKRRNKYGEACGDVAAVSMVGYVGKSTIFNRMDAAANVPVDDGCFTTLDTIVRRVEKKKGLKFLLMDGLGFISDMPKTVVNGFSLSWEELSAASLIVHVGDIGNYYAYLQVDAVNEKLSKLKLLAIPKLVIWNKVDLFVNPSDMKLKADRNEDIFCVCALKALVPCDLARRLWDSSEALRMGLLFCPQYEIPTFSLHTIFGSARK